MMDFIMVPAVMTIITLGAVSYTHLQNSNAVAELAFGLMVMAVRNMYNEMCIRDRL